MFVKLAFRYSNSDKVVILMREKKEINIQIGKQVKLAREKSRLTQEQLAEKAGISASFLGHIERGTRIASLETLIELCNTLQVSPDYLLSASLNADDL